MIRHLTLLVVGVATLAGCVKDPPPRSVTEFLDNPILLEAAMVRCAEDRSGTRYEAECINAREAVNRIAAKEEAARKVDLEARSIVVRRARRRAQQAAAEVRRRAVEAERLRQEQEYLDQFGVAPPADSDSVPQSELRGDEQSAQTPPMEVEVVPLTDDADSDTQAAPPPAEEEAGTDLDAVREELRRRNDEGGS